MAEDSGTSTAPPERRREFVEFLETVQEGRYVDLLGHQLKEMVLALQHDARNTGGKPKGTLTLKIAFKLEDGVLEVLANSTTALPKPVTTRSIFYALPDGRVAENNPKQLGMDLPVRDVAAPALGSVRSISSAPAAREAR
jgi:hypothetical protein